MRIFKKTVIYTLLFVLLFNLVSCSMESSDTYNNDDQEEETTLSTEESDPKKNDGKDITRTVMIYIVGSDLESQHGMATADIDEMMNSGTDFEKNNILIYAGGASEWQNDKISANKNSIYLLKENDIEELDVSSGKSMGKSSTLSDFLKYGEKNFPADRYSLILWNHGGGPILGYGLDERYSYDLLDMSELSKALQNSPFGKSNKLELIGFDACLMGSVETAWVFKDYAEYFVASQEAEPGYGWDYEFLKKLDDCDNGADIGKYIIDSYFDFYEELFDDHPRMESEITLSCLDLSKISTVEKKLNDLFATVDSDIMKGKISDASRCRYKAKSFGKFSSNMDYDLVDLPDITDRLSGEYPDEADKLKESLEDLIVYSRANVKNANGVSIYHPYGSLEYASSWVKEFEKIGFAEDYADYIKHFTSELSESDSSGSGFLNFSKTAGVAKPDGQANDLSIMLTDEQAEQFSDAQYYIFKKLSAEKTFSKEVEYLHIYSGQDAKLSSDGTLSARYEGKAVFGKDAKTGKYSDFPLSMNQIYDGTKEEKFYFPCMFWDFGEELEMNLEPVNWLMKVKNGKPILLGAYSLDADKSHMFPDKYLINSEDYDVYTFANNSYTTTTDENGNVQFVFTGSSYGFEYNRDDGFSIELRPIPKDEKDEYFAVFIIEDIYGNSYTSDFFSLG